MKEARTTTHRGRNNLDSLRLLLAGLVVLEHANNLFHVANDDPSRFNFFLLNLSDVAVSCFFIISGMLTYFSYERDPDTIRFYLRRLFRIFPAYWSVVILQAAVFCLIAAHLVNWREIPLYLFVNMLTANFLDPSFVEGIPAINGSLWTIKIEATYYLIVPFIFPILRRAPLLFVLATFSFFWSIGIESETLAKQLPGKIYLFSIGVALAKISENIKEHHSLVALILIPIGITVKFTFQYTPVIQEAIIAALGVCFVIAFMKPWLQWEPLDISYTLYLTHYPILVLVSRFALPNASFGETLIVGLVLSVVAAVILTKSVERPYLKVGRVVVDRLSKPKVLPEQGAPSR